MKEVQQIMLKATATLALLLTLNSTSFSQVQDTLNSSPKLGLVLSGGGAKGLAHIGVLKVLEELGIRPDIITGTSIGSIVGALYASGYTADELSQINEQIDWEQLLGDDEKLLKVAMDEKREAQKYLFEFPFAKKKINLPSGLITGQHLENYFSKLLWPSVENQDFNQLSIPFHCISVDILSGKMVEHKSGDLVKAIRASMSIPSVFSPVEMDSMLLVDGGVMRNFPIDEAIKMGADIIIGVYVGFQDKQKKEDLNSMTAILQRSVMLAGMVDARGKDGNCNVLIVPDLENYTPADFAKGKIIEQLGEDAARENLHQLKDLVDKYQLRSKPIKKKQQLDKILISSIEVKGLNYLTDKFIKSESGIEPGDYVSFQDIQDAIEFMYGTRHFRKLTYSLRDNTPLEGYTLIFHAKENVPARFKLAPYYNNALGVGLVTNLTLRNFIFPSSRLLLSLNIAENPAINIELSKKLGNRKRFTNHFLLNAHSYKLSLYEKGKPLGNYNYQYLKGSYGISYALGLSSKIAVDFSFRNSRIIPHADFKVIYPEANFNKYKTNEWMYEISYEINTKDHLYFPKRGIDFKAKFSHPFRSKFKLSTNSGTSAEDFFVPESKGSYVSFTLQHNWYYTFAKRFTCSLGSGLGFSTEETSFNGLFMLGGTPFNCKLNFKNFAGYSFGELYASNYLYARTGLDIHLFKGLYLSGTVNGGMATDFPLEMIFYPENYPDYLIGYRVGLKYSSILGPIQLAVADNNKDGKIRWHLHIGFPF